MQKFSRGGEVQLRCSGGVAEYVLRFSRGGADLMQRCSGASATKTQRCCRGTEYVLTRFSRANCAGDCSGAEVVQSWVTRRFSRGGAEQVQVQVQV